MNTPVRPAPKVLLVHDGTDYTAHLRHLSTAGLDVSTAHGHDAVAVAIETRPDIVILDFRCDGEIVASLKADAATRHIPVIALAELAAAAGVFDVPNTEE